ncbi:hypothetical protein [Thalassoglobus sp.]|uniref:BatD family protein n=1 Tax=Thalassoglobus sp. TaxID=2795869 RepID=UPI003AA8FB98
MKSLLLALIMLSLCFRSSFESIFAQEKSKEAVKTVQIEATKPEAWLGQKLSFYVKVKASGPFSGATSFSLPELPKVLIIKIGNPVVSSEEIGGDTWTVQTHEFALFSQVAGTVTIPEFQVRYSSRQGFTGPADDHVEQVPSLAVKIKSPPDHQPGQFVVTTTTFDVQESWQPVPKSAKEGDVFKRTITQTAEQVSGMALPPPPQKAPEGIRVYTRPPTATDQTERGDFSGKREDSLTYVLQKSGKMTLPAIQYVWWNPDKESFDSKTLPSVTFEVAKVSQPVIADESTEQQSFTIFWLSGIIVCGSLLVWQRQQVVHTAIQLRNYINPPPKIAARELLRACRGHDVKAAERAWFKWVQFQPASFQTPPPLQAALTELHSHTYGNKTSLWDGTLLEEAFRDELPTHQKQHRSTKNSLPPLNPSS